MFKNAFLASDKFISSSRFVRAEVNGQRAELLRIKSEYVHFKKSFIKIQYCSFSSLLLSSVPGSSTRI